MKTSIVTVVLCGLVVFCQSVTAIAEVNYGILVPIQGRTFKTISAIDWSPDGQWIAFAAPGKSIWVLPDKDVPTSDIWLISSEGGIAKNLTNGAENGEYNGSYHWPCFTFDSSEITYSKQMDLFEGDVRKQEFSIESINIQTNEQREIITKNATLGFWSNDGKYMVYIDMTDDPVQFNQDRFSFTILDYDKNHEEYNNTFSDDGWPRFDFGISCFIPNNTQFLTTLLEKEPVVNDNPWALYAISLENGECEKLISQGSPYYPTYSPDGKWILYTDINLTYNTTSSGYTSDQFFELCVYNVETEEIIKLLPDSEYWNYYGRWSPDGTQICYILRKEDRSELRIIDFEYAEQPIQVSAEEETPDGFKLTGNYPNPFNPSTTIEFTLPEAGFTDLVVYNMTGQKIRELVSQTMTAGIHSVVWDGCDDSGITVSAGMYLTRLRMGENVQTGSMTLVK